MEEIEDLERITCLSGIRRSGKTTILYQYIDHLLTTSDPQKIVYVSMDDLLGRVDCIHDLMNVQQFPLSRPPYTLDLTY